MSRQKLYDFQKFALEILPHEAQYLLTIEQFQDKDNLNILRKILKLSENPGMLPEFNTAIDKRKYSRLKAWITEQLARIDVDKFYLWLSGLEKDIMTDSISPTDEKELIRLISTYKDPGFYFLRLYEVVQSYRFYLLIRVRHEAGAQAALFLDKYAEVYKRGRETNQKLLQATEDIIRQYSLSNTETRQWEQWLISVFKDSSLDGLSRYYAIIRLTFLYYNYKEYDRLIQLYQELDGLFAKGQFYSPRILVNYYSNRLLIHSRLNQMGLAEKYGYLSVKHKGTDYIHYVNTLCAVLLRQNKPKVAYKLMLEAFPDARNASSSHNRIGFASYYIQTLTRLGKAADADSYARSFMDNWQKQILSHRWHLFFVSYFFALIHLEKYREIIALVKKFQLLDKETDYSQRAGYTPVLLWYYQLSLFIECHIDKAALYQFLYESALPYINDNHKCRQLKELCLDLQMFDNEVFSKLRQALFLY